MENWKPVPDWEGIYEVSDLGRVRRLVKGTGTKPGRFLNPCFGSNGYVLVHFHYQGRSHARTLHGLVAEAFIGPRPHNFEVNHRDGDKGNNRASNLEYVSRRDNLLHSYKFLGRSRNSMPGEKNHKAKLTAADVAEIRRRYSAGQTTHKELAAAFSVAETTIAFITQRRTWKHIA